MWIRVVTSKSSESKQYYLYGLFAPFASKISILKEQKGRGPGWLNTFSKGKTMPLLRRSNGF